VGCFLLGIRHFAAAIGVTPAENRCLTRQEFRMNLHFRVPATLFCGALALAAISPAQTPSQQRVSVTPDISQSLSALADQPPTHIGFVFDRSMLQSARKILEAQGMPPERAAVALESISYDNYLYKHPAVYAPDSMESILAAYRAAGWKHLVNAHEPTADAPAQRMATDLWLHFSGSDIDGVTVLTRGAKDVNVVQIACDLRPMDLLHLGGHFGIPKVDPSAVMVPDPKDK
jgi:hypothetical protein